ncbi:MAG: transferase [Pedobacter sp.]|jgi:putative colanic acid biosynthesis acetyltransferase WcaF|nr:transferase [Pedobacter sp.]
MVNHDTHIGPSFSLKNRLARLLWTISAVLFFHLSPRPFHSWRSFLLRLFGAKVGKGVHVYPGVKIWAPWNLDLADECGIASGAILYSQGKITIGKRAVVSQGAHLVTGTHDYTKPGFPLVTRSITVCDQAWIATEAFIHPGVTIGEGCIIGARAVVSKDMPAWKICSGHPCEPIKERNLNKNKLWKVI